MTVPHLRAAHPDADAELMAAVIEQAPTPLWVIAGGRVELVNRAAVSLLGYSTAADLVGQASHCALHERRPDGSAYPQEACPIVASAAAARPAHGREWFTTSAGVPLPVTWTTRRLGVSDATLLAFDTAAPAGQAATVPPSRPPRARTRADLRAELLHQIHENFRDPGFSVSTLATRNHLSVRSVQTLFAEAGRTPAEAIRRARLEYARLLLERGASVRSACYDSGFIDPGTFSRAFRRHYGRSPTRLLRSAPGPVTHETHTQVR
ncbi:MAG TPA: helix-turn-helix domain-containing protein [Nocardia sp.]|uniref:helix-turn-helix domain-containing protein n=1 Tax=Nocardia TaxID=1817 RepID=UPI0024537761|nr:MULTISPECIES: helix-turn-helix domain-containing protein [Nocardia]HLS76151.1 helix-turn-helix domain-containing protein [Nocardia sp.]